MCYAARMRRFLFVVASFAFALAASCSDNGGGGDLKWTTPNAKPFGNPIASVTDPKTRIKDGTTFHAQGVVVIAVDNYDETNDGKSIGDIFVQDPVQTGPKGTPWSAIRLYRSTRNPADLQLNPGSGVDFTGDFSAFAGPPSSPFNPGIIDPEVTNGSLTLTYESEPPEPIDLTFDDLKDPVAALQYVNRLVRIKNVPIIGAFTTRKEAPITADGSMTIASRFLSLPDQKAVTMGATLKSVTGVLDYFYSYKLCPRSPADITP